MRAAPIGDVRWGAVAAAAWVLLAGIGPAPAQTAPSAATDAGERRSSADPTPSTDPKQQLESVETTLTQSDEHRRQFEADIEEARTDRLRFNAALIETTEKVRAAEGKVIETTTRLETLTGSEEAIRHSLEARRNVIADVLASLQRLGLKPPPAILVRPDDILKTIRTSMLLGAVLPQLRDQAETLATDLTELTRVRTSITADRDTLASQVAALGAETVRLQGLVDARQRAQADAEASLGQERVRATDLARQATSLKDLIGRMEGGVAMARKAAEAAHAAEDSQRKAAEADSESIKAKVAAGPFRDAARLQPAVPFADTKGLLPLPASGRFVKYYGQPDGFGGSEKGMSLATPPRAIVTSPADGWVAFSGPYRTYGQVLILNLGGGYYSVLAGMGHVDVAPGQFVLSGEPVGAMGDGTVKTAAAIALGAGDPVLYVELRKDGAAVDPSPWWAKAALEKVRG